MGAEGVAGLSKKGAAIAARPRILIIDEEKEQLLRDRFARIQLQDSDVNTNTEAYDATVENPFEAVARQPLSTLLDRRRYGFVCQRAPLFASGYAPARGSRADRGAGELFPL